MPYLIFDLEMTGSEYDYHDIIEIGAILCNDNWEKISEYQSLVYPNNFETHSKQAEEIHGITIADLEDAPMSYEVLEEFENWIRKTLRRAKHDSLFDVILCGQSVINDINFLKFEFENQNIDWPFSFKLLDLLTMSFVFYKIMDNNEIRHPKSYSLESVAKMFNIQRDNDEHNALEDANITFLCMKEYMKISDNLKLTI